jgi:hypothetical protein
MSAFLILLNGVYADVSNYGDASALIYNGTDEYNEELAMNGNDQFSTAFWVAPTASNQLNNGGILLNKENTYEVALTTDNRIKYAIHVTDENGQNAGWAWITTNVTLTPNEYSHIALTYDKGNVKIYKDGQLVYDETNPEYDYQIPWSGDTYLHNGSLITVDKYKDAPLYIANRPAVNHSKGAYVNMSGVGIFNRSLTPEEIKKLANGTMTFEDLNNSGCIFFAPLINDTNEIMRNVTNGTFIGNTIAFIPGQAPEPLKRMMDPNNFYRNNARPPVKTPIPLPALLLTISLTTYMALRKRS